ncbi:MAG: GNAT family N-acetyltransferase [Cytophagales bacterium]|nr:GNAT family N-acetyltransferase [Bernardetiaceae bacterium]MDW8210223.1 GNAT family N-acetyltransferase [Cytophagales bacterium]
MEIIVQVASQEHLKYAEEICRQIEESAKARGTGIAKRDPEYIRQKMREGKAIIALTDSGEFAGFCYIETWSHAKYVANSGLIVKPEFRQHGLARKIKEKAFQLSREKYPDAKIFGLTTSLPVMKINSELGYRPVTFSELTSDEEFWKGCQSCVNYDILTRTNRKHCLCTGMLYDPAWEKEKKKDEPEPKKVFKLKEKIYERWLRFKAFVLLKDRDKNNYEQQKNGSHVNQAPEKTTITVKSL